MAVMIDGRDSNEPPSFDALGDSREEVFVYNGHALWIYANAAEHPANLPEPDRRADPRIYNASFYVGWQ